MYTYRPTYYSTLNDSITSLCKTILPFSLKKPRLLAAERKLSKLQSDNLKWQQECFHQISNLIELAKAGILEESEVSAFRLHLLETLVASPTEHEQPVILRDKLIFLQDLTYAKCISEAEYHFSKRPLLQRLSVEGAEIETKHLILPSSSSPTCKTEHDDENGEDGWTVIDLHADHLNKKDNPAIICSKQENFASPRFAKNHRGKQVGGVASLQNRWAKHVWGFEGFRKWRRKDSDDDYPHAFSQNNERKDDEQHFSKSHFFVHNPTGEGPDTRQIKRKLHSDGSPSDFFIDKVLGEKIKQELSRIQTELCQTNPNLRFSDDQIEAISTKLPVDKTDLKKFFPKPWCDRYGDVVLDVVKKEFKEHVRDMENMRNATRVKRNSSKRWVSFEEEEDNWHPNVFSQRFVH